jgi:SAM-dependent methyltransferase
MNQSISGFQSESGNENQKVESTEPKFAKHISKFRRTTKVLINNIENGLPFKNESFNGVINSQVLEHLFDVPKTVVEIKRILNNMQSVHTIIPH